MEKRDSVGGSFRVTRERGGEDERIDGRNQHEEIELKQEGFRGRRLQMQYRGGEKRRCAAVADFREPL